MPVGRILLVVMIFVVINLPFAHQQWLGHQLASDGEVVSAEIVEVGEQGEIPTLTFRFPDDIDAQERDWTAPVTSQTYAQAEDSGSVEVRVLPDDPQVFEVAGQRSSNVDLVITIIGNLALFTMVGLMWLHYRRTQPAKVLFELTEDITRCKPGSLMQQVGPTEYIVQGEVSGLSDDEVELIVAGRPITFRLNGCANPVRYQQPALARGRLLRGKP